MVIWVLSWLLPVSLQAQHLLSPPKAVQNSGVVVLSGKWRFQLDPENIGIKEQWFKRTQWNDVIQLPGTTDEQKKGAPEQKQSGRFTRVHAYQGPAWYQIEVNIPKSFAGKKLLFSMERTKVTKVWYDDELIGGDNSLITTQYFEMDNNTKPGKHTITVRVNNGSDENPPIGSNHQVTDGTQTNWNGILGTIQLKAVANVYMKDVQVFPDIDKQKARVKVRFGNKADCKIHGLLLIKAQSWNTTKPHVIKPFTVAVQLVKKNAVVEFDVPMGNEMQLWSEFNPALYRLSVEFKGNAKTSSDKKEVDFGMRKFHTIGTGFAINGKKTFLRGKHDGAVFPHTGYPPMEVKEWMRTLSIVKSYGINHIRCHTWTPPAAAFTACDRLGMYLLPELPHWGGVGNKPTVVQGDVEQKTEVYDNTTEYLIKEGYRLFDEFGNHASFVMFEIGNELSGDRNAINDIITNFKDYDSRHLYAGGANNFLWQPLQSPVDDFWATTMTGGTYGTGVYKNTNGFEVRSSYPSHKEGHVNNILKGTDYDYSSAIKQVTVPVISHENGQFQVYPNYTEIEKFTGVTRAYNFEIYRDRLAKAGMAHLADSFFKASGALAVICYREDIESAIRTPDFGGFQVLDLQDFPGQGTALVGILDSYLNSKGLISPEKWREFCNDVVPLLRHKSFTWTTDQVFTTKANIANYSAGDIDKPAEWSIKNEQGEIIKKGMLPRKNITQGGVTGLGEIHVSLNDIPAPQKLEVTLSLPGTVYKNAYSIWVYPADVKTAMPDAVKVFYTFSNEAKEALNKGQKVLILPAREVMPTSIDGAFQTDFWCYAMFGKYNPPGTMGILCNPQHPALADFPTEFHSNWQWWRLLKNGRPINLEKLPEEYRPIVQVIDNVTTNRRLGVMLEAKVGKGRLLVCSMDLQNQQQYPEARQMYSSIFNYINSEKFNPIIELKVDEIAAIVTAETVK